MRDLGTSFVSNGYYMWFRAVNVNRQFVAENGKGGCPGIFPLMGFLKASPTHLKIDEQDI